MTRRSEITFNAFKKATKDDWFLDNITKDEFDKLDACIVIKLFDDAIADPGTPELR
jgi:hypothetical protein